MKITIGRRGITPPLGALGSGSPPKLLELLEGWISRRSVFPNRDGCSWLQDPHEQGWICFHQPFGSPESDATKANAPIAQHIAILASHAKTIASEHLISFQRIREGRLFGRPPLLGTSDVPWLPGQRYAPSAAGMRRRRALHQRAAAPVFLGAGLIPPAGFSGRCRQEWESPPRSLWRISESVLAARVSRVSHVLSVSPERCRYRRPSPA